MNRYELNSQVFHDGRLILYQRPNLKRPNWQVRIKVPGVTGYVIKSTGTHDSFEARRIAEDLYDELRLKVRQGLSVRGKPFAKLFDEFLKAYPNEAPSKRRVADIEKFVKAYALPYFGERKIEDITAADVTKFFDWRREHSIRKTPTNNTIRADMGLLKTFFDWCYRRGHTARRIEFERPSTEGNRRPHFDERDWAKLTRFLREWVKRGSSENGGGKHRERVMLTNYVLILANTGIRVGEARGLRWRDIDTERAKDESNPANIILQVKGKTGAREVVARTGAVKEYLARIWRLRCDELGKKPSLDECIFAHRDGRPIHSFKKGFENLLRAAGVQRDGTGQRRTIYSLRHTYATFRLREGVHHFTLARNMGTSVKMLEQFYGHTSNRAMADELTKTRNRTIRRLPWE